MDVLKWILGDETNGPLKLRTLLSVLSRIIVWDGDEFSIFIKSWTYDEKPVAMKNVREENGDTKTLHEI